MKKKKKIHTNKALMVGIMHLKNHHWHIVDLLHFQESKSMSKALVL